MSAQTTQVHTMNLKWSLTTPEDFLPTPKTSPHVSEEEQQVNCVKSKVSDVSLPCLATPSPTARELASNVQKSTQGNGTKRNLTQRLVYLRRRNEFLINQVRTLKEENKSLKERLQNLESKETSLADESSRVNSFYEKAEIKSESESFDPSTEAKEGEYILEWLDFEGTFGGPVTER